MKKTSILFVFLVGSTAIGAHQSPCERGFRKDSVGLGIEAEFYGRNIIVSHMDSACYEAGKAETRQLGQRDLPRGEEVPSRLVCGRQFEAGKAAGLQASGATGPICFTLGYLAGEAWLNVGAREDMTELVGDQCIRSYRTGQRQAQTGATQTPPVYQPLATCYWTGFYDHADGIGD